MYRNPTLGGTPQQLALVYPKLRVVPDADRAAA
jgi:hypothetical protein